jgi:hypothetical protein
MGAAFLLSIFEGGSFSFACCFTETLAIYKEPESHKSASVIELPKFSKVLSHHLQHEGKFKKTFSNLL